MSRQVLVIALLISFLMGSSLLSVGIRPVKSTSNTLVVPDDYTTIQDAVNAANNGDTIFVRAGTYHKDVELNKTVHLVGEDKQTTTIEGNEHSNVVSITADDSEVCNFTIRNSGSGYYRSGIFVSYANGTKIHDNIIINCDLGIYMLNCGYGLITDNCLQDDYGFVILLDYCDFINFTDNGIVLKDLQTFGTWCVGMDYCDSCFISGNHITSYLPGFLEAKKSGATWWTMVIGMDIEFSYNTVIDSNVIRNCSCEGAILAYSANCTFSDNRILGEAQFDQLRLDASSCNEIVGNYLTNSASGLVLQFDSSCNNLSENTIWSNEVSIKIWANSNYNSFYHNNIIGNIQQAPSVSESSGNRWQSDYPSGGNYWADYAGVDQNSGQYQNLTGSDGIGDVPYVIDSGNRDQYPLMKPYFALFGDLNHDGKVNMEDIALVASAFGSSQADLRYDPRADINFDGKIDLKDVALVARHFGT